MALLHVLDEGSVTDSQGHKVHHRLRHSRAHKSANDVVTPEACDSVSSAGRVRCGTVST